MSDKAVEKAGKSAEEKDKENVDDRLADAHHSRDEKHAGQTDDLARYQEAEGGPLVHAEGHEPLHNGYPEDGAKI